MSLAVTCLGTSAMYATRESAASGYLVEIDDGRVWLDAGAGTWRNLLRIIDFTSIDAVVLSHVHPDHTTDIFQAYHARKYGVVEPLAPIPLWAPAQTLERVSAYVAELETVFDLQAAAPGDGLEFAGARLSFYEMRHPVDTVGVRVDKDGSVFAYTADTGPDGDLEGLAKGAGLLLSEATLQDRDGTWEGHLNACQAGQVAGDCEVSSLVLTHLMPGRDRGVSVAEARRCCSGISARAAEDGLRLEVGS